MSAIIIISGGIGAGKSVVSNILRTMGYSVYDCDKEAKRIMDSRSSIHALLNEHIHPQAVVDGVIDRQLIAQIVFNNSDKLRRLNSIVHKHVIEDVENEALKQHKDDILFVETAIPFESRLDSIAQSMWEVIAPDKLRIKRVMQRNNCKASDVEVRIKSQTSIHTLEAAIEIYEIVNDEVNPLLPQIHRLLEADKNHRHP